MRKRFINAVISLSLAVIIALGCVTPVNAALGANGNSKNNRDAFLIRCYDVVFDREPDEDGWNYWMRQIITDQITGTTLAKKFLSSDEYVNKNVSDEQYIADLYELFLGREADQEGYSYWTSQISNSSREDIFSGFANSDEFYGMCLECGMVAGLYTPAIDIDRLNMINLFVGRLYSGCLHRLGDKAGIQYWVEGLINQSFDGASCAYSFVFSDEYLTYGENIGTFVLDLYQIFMNRNGAVDPGYSYWIEQLEGGMKREQVFEGFVNSPEFDTICASYGIIRGYYVYDPNNSSQPVKSVTDILNNLEGVTEVDPYKGRYNFYVEQPIDWNDPDGAKFVQLVQFKFNGWDKPNVCEICGYDLNPDTSIEPVRLYDTNSVLIEHRFFGESCPKDLESDPYKYAKYNTQENMAKDAHHVIELLKTALSGKWVITGMSKGGEEAAFYAASYPHDADAYICYSAPFFPELCAPGMGDFLYTEIGNDIYGEEKAEEYRQYILDFQIAMLEARSEIQPYYIKNHPYSVEAEKKNGMTEDEIYDRKVVSYAWNFWDYGPESAPSAGIIKMVEQYRKGDLSFIDEIKEWWSVEDDTLGNDDRLKFIMFDIMTEQEHGMFRAEYKYLRDELKKRGSSGYVATTEEREKVIGGNSGCLDPKFYESTEYSNASYRKVIDMTHTIDVPVIMLYGSRDTMALYKLPVPDDNPNVHVFTATNVGHERSFSNTEVWADVAKILDPILKG